MDTIIRVKILLDVIDVKAYDQGAAKDDDERYDALQTVIDSAKNEIISIIEELITEREEPEERETVKEYRLNGANCETLDDLNILCKREGWRIHSIDGDGDLLLERDVPKGG